MPLESANKFEAILKKISQLTVESSKLANSKTFTKIYLEGNRLCVETIYDDGTYTLTKTCGLDDETILKRLNDLLSHAENIYKQVQKFIKVQQDLKECEEGVKNLIKPKGIKYDA